MVTAETRALVEDARDQVDVEYKPLEAIVTAADAEDPAKPPIVEELGTNVAYRSATTLGDPETAFADADVVVVSLQIDAPRVSQAPIDMRGGLADFDSESGLLVYEAATRNPHGVRGALAALLRHPLEQIHVVVPDIGGAFGQKANATREGRDHLFRGAFARAAGSLDRRSIENLTAATQGRGEKLHVSAAVKAYGTILGLQVEAVFDQGSYAVQFPLPARPRSSRARTPPA